MKMKIGLMIMNHGMLRIPIDFFIVKNVQKVINILPRITCGFDQKTLQYCVNNFHLQVWLEIANDCVNNLHLQVWLEIANDCVDNFHL